MDSHSNILKAQNLQTGKIIAPNFLMNRIDYYSKSIGEYEGIHSENVYIKMKNGSFSNNISNGDQIDIFQNKLIYYQIKEQILDLTEDQDKSFRDSQPN